MSSSTLSVCVNTSSHLDDQPPFGAREIGEESVDRMLPAEFPADELPIAKMTPKQPLGIGLAAPQVPCA